MIRSSVLKKFRLVSAIALVVCFGALASFAANSVGKPARESDVPGNWTVNMADPDQMWFSGLQNYSAEVRKHFPDPDPALFGDHPDFTTSMRENENNPTGVVKALTNQQMNAYLETLPKDNLSIRYLGDYPTGIRMPLLVFSKPKLSDPSGENLRALGKPIYYLRAQVHGNELAATAGAILLAQRLANNHPDLNGVLDRMSIVILPRMNGDGTKIQQRGTSLVSGDTWGTGKPDYFASEGPGGGQSEYTGRIMGGLDQNRDNLWVGSPVSRVNARILAEYMPEICLDAHEYGAHSTFGLPEKIASGDRFVYATDPAKGDRIVLRDPGGTHIYYKEQMTTQWGNHLVIPQALRTISDTIQNKIVAGMESRNNPTGAFFCAPYVEGRYGLIISGDVAAAGLVPLESIPSGERENMRKWADANGMVPDFKAYQMSTEGGFDPGTARNTMGLIPGISFLTESRSAGGRWELPRRTMGQYLTSLYYIRAVMDDLDNIKDAIDRARTDVLNAGKPENVGSQNYKMAVAQTYADLDYNNIVSYGVYHEDGSSEDVPGLRRNSRFGTVPTAEVTRPYAYIMDGSYMMANDIAFRMSNLGIRFSRTTEPLDLEVRAYTVTQAAPVTSFGATCKVTGVRDAVVTKTFPTGSYIFYMEQPMANFVALLFEPLSMRPWIGKDVKNEAVILNREVPFYRYEKTDAIRAAEAIDVLLLDFTDAFLYNTVPFEMAKLREARDKTRTNGYAQTVTVYGNIGSGSAIRAYLPSGGTRRTWYVLNRDTGEYVLRKTAFDADMNRDYIEIDPASRLSAGDGYHSFDMLATPAGQTGPSGGGGGSSGCTAGLQAALLLALLPLGAKGRNRKN